MNLRLWIAALCLFLCVGQAMASSISVDGVEPQSGTDTVLAGSVLKFHLRYTNTNDSGFNVTNAWIISSPDGATWNDSTGVTGNYKGANLGPLGIDTTGLLSKSQFPTVYTIRTFSSAGTIAKADGISPDTVTFSGAGNDFGLGLIPGFDARVLTIRVKTKLSDAGKHICIDSSMKFPPTNVWKWAALWPTTGTVIPDWGGGRCVTLFDPNQKSLQVNPTQLNFTAPEGGANPSTQTFNATEAGGGAIAYTSSATAAWISLTNPNGTTPGTVTVGVVTAGKTAGTYTDSVQVASGEASNSPKWVKVVFTVTAVSKVLVVAPTTLNFTATEGGANPVTQLFHVSEQGGAAIGYGSATDAAWINLTNPNGTTPGDVTVGVNIAGKVAGAYADSILVTAPTATNPEIWVKVNLTVNAAPKSLVLSPTTLNFEATEGGANPTDQKFGVSELGGGVIAYTATEGVGWISLTNASGNTPDSVTVSVSIAALTAGMYLDSVQVASAGATNTPQWVKIHLMVNAVPKVLVVAPDSLHFEATSTNPVPPTQAFDVSEQGGAAIPYVASETATWINLTNPNGTTPGSVTVGVDATALPVGNYVDTVLVVASATNSPQKVKVTLRVSACPTLVAGQTSFNVAGLAGQVISLTDTVGITSSGEALPFEAQAASHFAFDPIGGTTPAKIGFTFSNTYDTAGTYTACFTVATTGEPPAGCQSSSVDICVHVTVTEPLKHLVVNPGTLNFNAILGGPNPTPDIFMVSEGGGATIPYKLEEGAAWFSLNKAFGDTPDSVVVSPDITGLIAGTYHDSVKVTASNTDNSPQWVKVNLTVSACPILAINKTAIYDTIFAGETFSYGDSLMLTSTGPGELSWHAVHDSLFTVSAETGTTPSLFAMSFSATPNTLGVHQYCLEFATDEPSNAKPNAPVCQSSVSFCVNLLVLKAASADTLIVVNTPAVPGARVVVPINFKNDCNFKSAEFGLTFNSANLYLDSVSFANSRITFFDLALVTIDNVAGKVTVKAVANDAHLVAPGFGNLADLHFTVRPEAPETTYPLALIDTVVFGRDCGQGVVLEQPEFIAGNIIVATETNFVCGYVVDTLGNEIPGATVLLYADWPNGSPLASTTSSGIGSWFFDNFTAVPFDVYAYKTGYYPGWVENLNYGEKGVKIVLKPLKTFAATSQWVRYYCGTNTLFGAPIPVGSVVEAYDGSLLVGQFPVTEAGKYGEMPVYAASTDLSDDGAKTGDAITFFVNGIPSAGSAIYPADHMYPKVEFCLEAGEEITKSCTLQEGWNLVSWNVNTPSDDIKTVLGPYLNCIEVVLGFEQGGLAYDPALEDFSTLWSVDHLSGYWIKVKQGCPVTLEIKGTSVPVSTPIPVYPGWNLVSYLPETPMAPAAGFESIVDHLQFAYGWNNGIKIYSPGQGGFSQLTSLDPCNGYWLKVNAGDNLVYPGGAPGAAPRYAVQTPHNAAAANGVTPTTAWVNLYASNLKVDGNTIPAGAIITAKAANGATVGSFTTTHDGKFGFMPVYADASSDLKPGESFHLEVNGQVTEEQFTWTSNGDRVEVGALSTASGPGTLPASFSLAQNYPNPFNPSTTISFSVPAAGNAKIEIYNVLGALVAVAFDGSATAGNNTVVWDGKDLDGQSVASGIYLYRLSAGAASETKKMMLLK